MLDAPDPAKPTLDSFTGLAVAQDDGTGSVSRQMNFASFPVSHPMSRFAPAAATPHTFSVFLASTECNSGSGITVDGGAIDVLGVR